MCSKYGHNYNRKPVKKKDAIKRTSIRHTSLDRVIYPLAVSCGLICIYALHSLPEYLAIYLVKLCLKKKTQLSICHQTVFEN